MGAAPASAAYAVGDGSGDRWHAAHNPGRALVCARGSIAHAIGWTQMGAIDVFEGWGAERFWCRANIDSPYRLDLSRRKLQEDSSVIDRGIGGNWELN